MFGLWGFCFDFPFSFALFSFCCCVLHAVGVLGVLCIFCVLLFWLVLVIVCCAVFVGSVWKIVCGVDTWCAGVVMGLGFVVIVVPVVYCVCFGVLCI